MNNVLHTVGTLLSDKRAHDCIPAVSVCAMILCATLIFLNSTPPRPFHSYASSLEILFLLFRRHFPPAHSVLLFCFAWPPDTRAQQAFRTEPRNLTVRMGETAVLRCEVLRPSGTVQWVKDGLLLGPERSLPGFPRYSMIVNPQKGEPARNKIYSLLEFYGPIHAEKKKRKEYFITPFVVANNANLKVHLRTRQ